MAIIGLGEIAEKLRRSTVLLHAGLRGSGSGVIWTGDGLIVTNAHVARSSPARVQLWDGREFEATVTARDLRRDRTEPQRTRAHFCRIDVIGDYTVSYTHLTLPTICSV